MLVLRIPTLAVVRCAAIPMIVGSRLAKRIAGVSMSRCLLKSSRGFPLRHAESHVCADAVYRAARLNGSFGRNVRLIEATLMMLVRAAFNLATEPCFARVYSLRECVLNLDNRFQSLYCLRCFCGFLRRQGSPVKIRRGPATVMATKAATQVTVLS